MIFLDTHAWLWWVSNPELLSKKAQKAIDTAVSEKAVCISTISSWEVALLVSKGRLKLSLDVQDWIDKTEALPFVNFIPINNRVAVKSVHLPGNLHPDPADRIIVASALTMDATIITKDKKILNYGHVKTVW